jgi:hypothetical protein
MERIRRDTPHSPTCGQGTNANIFTGNNVNANIGEPNFLGGPIGIPNGTGINGTVA